MHNLSIPSSFPLNFDLFVVYLVLLFLEYFIAAITVLVDFSGCFPGGIIEHSSLYFGVTE